MQSNATNFLKPRIIDVQNLSPTHAKVMMEPFERGYGHTLGNALRRILLSSMPGYAATEVKIAGVLHEYSTIDGVQEDVVDMLLNLKGIVLKLHNRDEVTLKLKKDRRRRGHRRRHRADARRRNHQSRSRHRAPDARAASSTMQIKVEKGRGYVPRDIAPQRGCARASARSCWTPRSARCAASATRWKAARVEQRTDLDKLVIDIETNGAIEPEEAVRYAARVLVDQLSVFADPCRRPARRGSRDDASRRSIRCCCVRWTTWN